MKAQIVIRNARAEDFADIGKMLVRVYAQLEGFSKPHEQPHYYKTLLNVGEFVKKPATEIFAAYTPAGSVVGAVVFLGNMQHYGSGGSADVEKDTAALRLLAVHEEARGKGIGRMLTQTCIRRARSLGLAQMIIHTTSAMPAAWKMYEKIGFKRAEELDFMQGDLRVCGFRLALI